MNATILDLRRHMKDVLAALDRNEPVMLTYRGKNRAVLVPCSGKASGKSVAAHPAFGIWAKRKDLANVSAYVRNLRRERF